MSTLPEDGPRLRMKQKALELVPLAFILIVKFVVTAAACVGLAAMGVPRTNSGTLTASLPKQSGSLRGERSPNETQTPDKPRSPTLDLKVGESIQREITGGDGQVLTVALLRGQYAQVAFEWQGMDLDVQVRGPEASGYKSSNTRVRGSGSPPVSIIANKDGHYSLVVRPVENAKITGSYGVVLETVRSPSPVDQKRVDAENLIGEAEREKIPNAATDKLRKALQLWNELGDAHGTADTLQQLGRHHLQSGKASTPSDASQSKQTSAEYYRRAIEIVRNGNPQQLAYTLLNIGSDYERLTSPVNAFAYYQEASEIFRASGNQRGEALALFSLGLAQGRMTQWDEALKSYLAALAGNRSVNDRLEEARTLNAIGGVHWGQAKQDLALSYYQQSALVMQELGDRYREAIATNNIGLVYDDLGDLQTARDQYSKSLSILTLLLTTKDRDTCRDKIVEEDRRICRSIANTLDSIGELYSTLGDTTSALATLHESLLIRYVVKEPRGTGATLSRIAYAHLLQNEPMEALEYCDRALPFSRAGGDLRKQGSILTFRGMAHAALNKTDQALEYYRQALELHENENERVDDRRGKAIVHDQMGRAHALKQDTVQALSSYESALKIWREIKDQEWEPRTLYNLANAERDRGNLAAAKAQIEQALQIVESRRGSLKNLQLRTAYFANKADIYHLGVDLQMQLSKAGDRDRHVALALEISDRARARTLVDTLSTANLNRKLVDSFDPHLEPKLAQIIARKQLLQDRLKNRSQATLLSDKPTPAQAAEISKEVRDLTNQQDELLAEITAIDPRYAAMIRPNAPNAGEIQQLLDQDTLLVEYSLGDKRSYVWVVSPDSIKGVDLGPRDQIESLARRVTETLTARNREVKNESFAKKNLRVDKAEKDYVEASAELSKMVIEPVASLLRQKRLVIVADGALQVVPFGALPAPVNSTTAVMSNAKADPAIAANLSPTSSNPLSSFSQTMARSITLTGLMQSGTNPLSIARPVPLIAGSGSKPLNSEHEIVYLPSASVLALQRRELANRKPAPYAVAVLADPVFDIDDARVAKAKGNGNEPRKDLATNSGKDTAKIAPKATILPKEGTPHSTVSQDSPSQASASQSSANASSASPGLATSTAPKQQSLLAGALRDVGLDPNQPMPRLTHSLHEAKAIFQAAGPNQSFSALNFKASRETATSPELAKYRIIHFATHGVLDLEHPELSGIVLSMVDENGQPQDGYLRLHEIYNLYLPAELVVLSACQTGVGKQIKGEGLIALTRGFMYAGAKSVVASLWKVDDAATSALMTEFYKQMFTNKLKPAAALREAQIKISQQKRWQSPYYWAGFFIQGEWN